MSEAQHVRTCSNTTARPSCESMAAMVDFLSSFATVMMCTLLQDSTSLIVMTCFIHDLTVEQRSKWFLPRS